MGLLVQFVQFVPSFSSPLVEDAQNGPSSIASPLDLVSLSQGQRLSRPLGNKSRCWVCSNDSLDSQ